MLRGNYNFEKKKKKGEKKNDENDNNSMQSIVDVAGRLDTRSIERDGLRRVNGTNTAADTRPRIVGINWKNVTINRA